MGARAARTPRDRRRPHRRPRRDRRPALPCGGDPRPGRGRLPGRLPARPVPARRRARGAREAAAARRHQRGRHLRSPRSPQPPGRAPAVDGRRQPAGAPEREAAHGAARALCRERRPPRRPLRRRPRPHRSCPAARRCSHDPGPLLEARRLFHRARLQAGERLVLSYPRADARTGRERLPSLFFAAAAATLAGRPLAGRGSRALDRRGRDRPAGARGRARRGRARPRAPAARPHGRRHCAGRGLAVLPAVAPRHRRARWSTGSRVYDGLVGEIEEPLRGSLDPLRARTAMSASRLATFARCGFQYLLQHVLRLAAGAGARGAPPARPARARGSLPPRRRDLPARAAHAGELPLRDTPALARAAARAQPKQALEGLVRGTPPRFTLLWQREKRRFHETAQGWLTRELAQVDRTAARALRAELRPRPAADAGEPHSPDPLEIDLGDGRVLRVCGKIDRIDRRLEGGLVLRDYKTGRAPKDDGGVFRGGRQTADPVLRAGRGAASSRARTSSTPSSTTSTPGARSRSGRSWRGGPAFSRLLGRAGVADRARRLRAGAGGLRVLRLQGRLRAGAAARTAARDQGRRPAAAALPAPAGRVVSAFLPVDHEARERARKRPRREPRRRGRRRHRQDDAPGRPHRGAGAPGSRAAHRDRCRHLHRERRHHDEAAPARAPRALARRRGALAASGARTGGRSSRRARARERQHDPRAVRADAAGAARSSAASCRASGWPTRRRQTRCSPRPGRSGSASGCRAATRCCSTRSTAASRSRAAAGARRPRCAVWRARWSTSATSSRSSPARRPLGAGARRAAASRPERGADARAGGPRRRQPGRAAAPAAIVRGGRRAASAAARSSSTCCSCRPSRRTWARRATGPRRSGSAKPRAIAAWTKRGARSAGPRSSSAAVHGRIVRSLADVVRLYERRKAALGVLDFLDLLRRRATRCATARVSRAWFAQRFPVRGDRRVPGHRPAAGRDRPAPRGRAARARWSWSATPSSRSTASAAPRCACSASWWRAPRPRTAARCCTWCRTSARGPAILRFVNRVFGELIQHSEEADQPPYEPLAPRPDLDGEPAVVALRFATRRPERLRRRPARRRGGGARALPGARRARRRDGARPGERCHARASRAGDALVLARRLTRVGHLEEALEAAGLRFTVEGGKSFFDRQEVHETLAVLRAIEDPARPHPRWSPRCARPSSA